MDGFDIDFGPVEDNPDALAAQAELEIAQTKRGALPQPVPAGLLIHLRVSTQESAPNTRTGRTTPATGRSETRFVA